MAGTDRPLFPDSSRGPGGRRSVPRAGAAGPSRPAAPGPRGSGPGGAPGSGPRGATGRPAGRPAGAGPGARGRSGGAGGAGGPGGAGRGGAAGRPRKGWLRRTLQVLGLGALAAVLLVVAGVAVAYVRTPIPDPNDAVFAETTTLYYADGVSVLGTFAAQDRTIVGTEEIPDTVRQAVVAAEDRTFYENPGISPTGIARAALGIVTGEPAGGGSTITQQYVKNYFLTSDQTYQRKFREILISLKVERRLDKDQILTDYLNTVYFGRGAYGVQAAAQAYFDVDASALTIEQAALLAGVLPAPNRYDPAEDPEATQERFDYVADGLVATEVLDQAAADALVLPATVVEGDEQVYAGPGGYLLQAAREELVDLGYDDERIDTGGLRVVTTFDPAVQAAVLEGVAAEMPTPEDTDGEPLSPGLRVAAVTIDPATGGIRGMYGGDDLLQRRNAVTKDTAQAGSTFKPFTLVAALEAGIPLDETFDGNSGREIEGYDRPVDNFGDTDYGRVDLVEATANSVNTAYVELNSEVGPEATREVAVRAGLPDDTLGLESFVSNVLGAASPRPVDMAQVMATFAAQGVRREWHVIAEVREPNGAVDFQADTAGQQVISPDVMSNATYAMTQVVEEGSGEYAQRLDRPVAGKTGTNSGAQAAWFVGYTPQLAGVVAMYQLDAEGNPETITIPGTRTVTGGSWPVRIWTGVMDRALEGQEVLEFPDPVDIEPADRSSEETEAPAPAPETEQQPEPSAPPVVTATVTAEPEPSVEPSEEPVEEPSEDPELPEEPSEEPVEPSVEPGDQGRAPVAPPGQGRAPVLPPGQAREPGPPEGPLP
ncbi:transglycosylase domain-containing protein [Aquipuribacter hungaricus]|uniref:transglycosylase domain-containing protein n=2 Tax=Aquipuribacter hungaricus TaxID=545624 RepID=UPI00360A96E2